jgi:hypothetical protein
LAVAGADVRPALQALDVLDAFLDGVEAALTTSVNSMRRITREPDAGAHRSAGPAAGRPGASRLADLGFALLPVGVLLGTASA